MSVSKCRWSELSKLSDEEIIAWAETQSWSRAMAECMQEPLWHAEGDVWTHTRMVCDELLKLKAWKTLGRSEQLKLLFTAIFHDSGKPATTAVDPESGRIRSPKHAEHGMRIARRALMELDCDGVVREEICHLILFHGRPPYLPAKANPELELVKLSWFVDHHLLYLFAMADTRGRICESDSGHAEETIELWKMVATENACLNHSYRFANDHARFLFYRDHLDNLHYVPHEDYRCKMTVMSGLPGAGKDRWLAVNRPELPVVSLDSIRQELKVSPTGNQGVVIQTARDRCREYLRKQEDFALNATNTTRQVRKLWLDIGADYDARVEIVYVEPKFEALFNQNSNRKAQVPEKVIQRLIDKLDPPTATECHEIVFQW